MSNPILAGPTLQIIELTAWSSDSSNQLCTWCAADNYIRNTLLANAQNLTITHTELEII